MPVEWSGTENEIEVGAEATPWPSLALEAFLRERTRLAADGRIVVPRAGWLGLSEPPTTDEPEAVDRWASEQRAFGELFEIASQAVRVSSIGFVGGESLKFVLDLDGRELADAPTGLLVQTSRGERTLLLPIVAGLHASISDWNRGSGRDRGSQLAFVARLRRSASRAVELLGSHFDLKVSFDEHLEKLRIEEPERFAIAWVPTAGAKTVQLEVEIINRDGTREVLPVSRLSKTSPVVSTADGRDIVLPPPVAEAARIASGNQNVLKRLAAAHFDSPATLFPEGLELDGWLDLSRYSARVVDFRPAVKVDDWGQVRSSGVDWFSGAEVYGPFLRLEIRDAGGATAVLVFATPDDAAALLAGLEARLAVGDATPLRHGTTMVVPTLALANILRRDLAHFARVMAPPVEDDSKDALGVDRLRPVLDVGAGEASEDPSSSSAAPLEQLAALLRPEVRLKPHQSHGVDWLWRHWRGGSPGVLLADDMGVGKTLQIAAFLALQRLAEGEVHGPVLVVAPKVLLRNWAQEIRQFFRPEVFGEPVLLHGDELRRFSVPKRGLNIHALAAERLVLTNYDTIANHQLSLLQIDWSTVVLDEAQRIKNPGTMRSLAARGLKRRFAIASTGTPVETRLADLWAVYDFASPGRPFGAHADFEAEFPDEDAGSAERVRTLLRYPSLGSTLLRRTKDQVLTLPPKRVTTQPVPMTLRQFDLERMIARSRATKNALVVLGELQRLYQHPVLLDEPALRRARGTPEQWIDESPKLALCVEWLRQIEAKSEKALIFVLWREMQLMIAETIRKYFGLRVDIINGDNSAEASVVVERFSQRPGFDVLVLSPVAAGTGLNIVAANHVIHYGRWWNPAMEDQATDRVYRIGQTRPVEVYYPLLHRPGNPSDGFDVKLHKLIESRRAQARDFLRPSDEQVSTEDLDSLLRQEGE